MRVLAHIHPFSAADLIDGTLDAVRRQTRPPDGILIGATTLRPTGRTFPEQVNPEALARLLNFALRPRTHGAQIRACLRGIWDGV
jgi:hypothetical protein